MKLFYFVTLLLMKSNIRAIARKISAFTLIELLIVIAIIAILTVVFLPTLRGGQVAARDAARRATVNDIVIGIEKLVNGDFSPDISAVIPVSVGGICLDFTSTESATVAYKVRKSLAKAPANQQTSDKQLCSGGYYYRTYKSGTNGDATTLATDTAVNYVVAVQVEDVKNANVNTVNDGGSAALNKTNIDNAFNNFTNALARTSGPADKPFYAVTK